MCVFDMQFERGVCVLRGISYRCVWPASGIKWGQILDTGGCWPGSLISTDARNSHSSTSRESAQCWRYMRQRWATARDSTRQLLCRLSAECRPISCSVLRVGRPPVGWAPEVRGLSDYGPLLCCSFVKKSAGGFVSCMPCIMRNSSPHSAVIRQICRPWMSWHKSGFHNRRPLSSSFYGEFSA